MNKDEFIHLDAFGHQIQVGDVVAYVIPVYHGLATGKVVRLGNKMIVVSHREGRAYRPLPRYARDCVINMDRRG